MKNSKTFYTVDRDYKILQEIIREITNLFSKNETTNNKIKKFKQIQTLNDIHKKNNVSFLDRSLPKQ